MIKTDLAGFFGHLDEKHHEVEPVVAGGFGHVVEQHVQVVVDLLSVHIRHVHALDAACSRSKPTNDVAAWLLTRKLLFVWSVTADTHPCGHVNSPMTPLWFSFSRMAISVSKCPASTSGLSFSATSPICDVSSFICAHLQVDKYRMLGTRLAIASGFELF